MEYTGTGCVAEIVGTVRCMNGGREAPEGTVTLWYDGARRHWRWSCGLCGEEHPTTAIEPDHDGPAQTAARNHIDRFHPDEGVIIEVLNADGDVDQDDESDRS